MSALTNSKPSSTASTIPAVRAEQLSWLISRGTEMWRVIGGSLSIIMSEKMKHKMRTNQHRIPMIDGRV